MDQREHCGVTLRGDRRKHSPAREREHLPLHYRLQRAQDEEDPDQVPETHRLRSVRL